MAMPQALVCTDDVAGFFARAKDAARRADRGKPFDGRVTLSFEDPQRMFAVLSEARRKLMLEVMHEPQTISQLSSRLHRHRSAITKDVRLLEKLGLIVSNREANPRRGIQKRVRAVAPKIELIATLG
jgi:predicted transcriptional regulator